MALSFSRRWAASLAGVVGLLAMTALYLLGPTEVYEAVLLTLGVEPFRFPFVDISGSLAVWECVRLGREVIESDPCDVLQRPYHYGPVWMDLAWIPLRQMDRPVVGWVLGLAFFLALAALPAPGPGRAALVARVLAVISPVCVFAVERANPDILLLLIALVVAWLIGGRGLARWGAYALVWLMAAIKYYPLTIMVLTLRERPVRFGVITLASIGGVAVYVAIYAEKMARGLPLIPAGRVDGDMFSARNLPLNIGLGAWNLVGDAPFGLPAVLLIMGMVAAGLGFGCWRGIRRLNGDATFGGMLGRMDAWTYACFLISCATVVGCFFTAQNVSYRAVWLLLALPGFSAMAACDAAIGVTGRRAVWLVVFVLWGEFFRRGIDNVIEGLNAPALLAWLPAWMFWLLRELAWWWLIMLMLAVLWRFAWDSPSGRLLRRATG